MGREESQMVQSLLVTQFLDINSEKLQTVLSVYVNLCSCDELTFECYNSLK